MGFGQISVIPFHNFVYSLGGTSFDYAYSKKDYGVLVTSIGLPMVV